MTKDFSVSANPLIFPGALGCDNIQQAGNYFFDYAVVLEDAHGNRTQEVAAGFTCTSQDLRCEQYARTAVAQYQQNLANRCGFTGAGWSNDYQGHYGWCLTASQAFADSETRARTEGLNRCIGDTSRCEHYARTAVAQYQQNLANRCGFTGARWSNDYQGHYGWCLTASQVFADSETRARTEGLNRCIASPTPNQRN